MSNIFAMADTWNNAGTTFTAIQMNVTDTASQSASLLLDLQIGGVSKFNVQKNGLMTAAFGIFGGAGTQVQIDFYHNGLGIGSAGSMYFGATDATVQSVGLSLKSSGVISVDSTVMGNSLGAFAPQTKAGAFVATDMPAGSWLVGRDTVGLTTKLYYNNAGTLMAVALA